MTVDLASLVPAVLAHAEREQPRECCGAAVVVRGRLRYWPCRNLASGNAFEIAPDDLAAAEDAGEVVGICHSHVYVPPTPSDADRVMCERTALPWLIVNWPTGAHLVIEPAGYKAPLVGRQYRHGVLDCYSIIRDYYAEVLEIPLPDFARGEDWWLEGCDLYRDGFASAGFVQLGDGRYPDMRKHDVLLMQIASPVPNHGAIWLGDGEILQHSRGRVSSRDPFGAPQRLLTTHLLRHRSLL